ncbi:UDP-Glycosyltransferase/glycogen phosphorylase [Wallemia mellicola]|nr:UDP-Glycosyltransferase/glycogen phosphorylase [Wallemia mellicola]
MSIELNKNAIEFIRLRCRSLVDDKSWPYFTLLGQAIGSILLILEAMYRCNGSAVFIEWQIRWDTRSLIQYTDMVSRVEHRYENVTNSQAIASSKLLSRGKLFYYKALIRAYTSCLKVCDVNMANSSWTANHLRKLIKRDVKIVYPPCDTVALREFPLGGRQKTILCVAQFRPEKAHATQIEALKELQESNSVHKNAKLILLGSARNQDDLKRVETLKALAKSLGVESNVQFIVNASFDDLLYNLSTASIGINTMIDEHFGINVVEYMAAGLIPLAHASAGPLLDIIVDYNGERTGYHGRDVKDFAQRIDEIFSLDSNKDLEMRQRARNSVVERLSDKKFNEDFLQVLP